MGFRNIQEKLRRISLLCGGAGGGPAGNTAREGGGGSGIEPIDIMAGSTNSGLC